MTSESRLADGKQLSRLLVAVGQDHDISAFKLLFESLAPRVRAFIGGRTADRAMIEDVVQETFVNVWRKAHSYDPAKAAAVTWIYTVARNVQIDLLRKTARLAVDPSDPVFVADDGASPYQQAAHARDKAQLQEALSRLPAEQREVLFLAFFAEKAHSEIAQELGLPLGTVKSRIRLALARLRQEFGETP
jgi:RNA polymerase sigma factor (sigma-70 family)